MNGRIVYGYRKCLDHFHVTVSGEDVIGGYCKTEEEVIEKVARLNNGEEYEKVLGTISHNIFGRRF